MTARSRDVFERWIPIWHAFFYAMVMAATGLLLSAWASEGKTGSRIAVLVAAGLSIAWHYAMLVRLGRTQREHPRRVSVYLAGAITLAAFLLSVDPIFLMVAMALYNQVFAFLIMRWAIPGAIVLTAVIVAMMTRTAGVGTLIGITIGAASALLFAWFLSASALENMKRRELIEELERTRGALALAERLAGVTEERHRVARELHDTVTQQLVGIVMHLDAATEGARSDPQKTQAALELALRLARDGLTEARRLVWAEGPRQLEQGSLSAALGSVADQLRAHGEIEVVLVLDGAVDELPAAVQTLVLRGVQEALANVRKHSGARRVAVTISADGDLVACDVDDDGGGFDPSSAGTKKVHGGGFGLRGLRERVEQLGGTLAIESERGRGTTVAFHVPLAPSKST